MDQSCQHGLRGFWNLLARVCMVNFDAHSLLESGGWNGHGTGTVTTKFVDDHTLQTSEAGIWNCSSGKRLDCSNIYRWTLCQQRNLVSLEHLRHGEHRPVRLFDFSCSKSGEMHPLAPFHCNQDQYLAKIEFTGETICMDWKISGPRKNEQILYSYRGIAPQ